MGQSTANIKMEDLLKYLQNPERHLKQIRNTSVYLTNKHGILKDAVRMVKTLPTLKYSLNWSVSDDADIKDHEDTVNNFLRDINVVKFIRDGLYEVAILGTVVPILRSKKYIQFLELDEITIRFQRNGKWIVEYDLSHLDSIKDTGEKINKINSLPDEITLKKYNDFKNKKNESLRYVELKNCEVVALDALRNTPYGLPLTIGTWYSLLQKEMIDNVEKSMSERLLTQILVLSAGHFDKEGNRPVTDDVVAPYFQGVSKMLQQKENTAKNKAGNVNGSGLIQLPYFLNLKSLEIDTTMFEKDLYDKIDDSIYSSLGISRALIFGEGGNYSSAQVNSEKLFSMIFSLVEQFESVVNNFIETILPKGVVCEIKFDKSTVLDKQTEIKNKYQQYLQTSIITPYLEAVMDMPIKDIVELRKYEMELGLENLFFPAQNAHTTSGNTQGRPSKGNEEIDNDNTAKTKGNGGNNNPSPSD